MSQKLKTKTPAALRVPLEHCPDAVSTAALIAIEARRKVPHMGQAVEIVSAGELVARSALVCRARVVITPTGLLRVIDLQHSTGGAGEGEPDARLLKAAEQASPQAALHQMALAQRLGFADWPALYAWAATYGPAALTGGQLVRQFVSWSKASLEIVS